MEYICFAPACSTASGDMLVVSGAAAAAAAAHCDCSCCTCCEAKKASACDRRELPVCTAPLAHEMLACRHICSEVDRKVSVFCGLAYAWYQPFRVHRSDPSLDLASRSRDRESDT